MTTFTLWLLVVVTNAGGAPSRIAEFEKQANCTSAAVQLSAQSAATRGAPNIYAFCIEAVWPARK